MTPVGFVSFAFNNDFVDAIMFCQNENLDVLDFQLHGSQYIAVFDIQDIFRLVFFCEEEALNFVKYILV